MQSSGPTGSGLERKAAATPESNTKRPRGGPGARLHNIRFFCSVYAPQVPCSACRRDPRGEIEAWQNEFAGYKLVHCP